MEKFKGFFIRRQIRICQKSAYTKNIAKGTTDPRLEFVSQDHSSQFTNIELGFRTYPKICMAVLTSDPLIF